MRKIALLMAAVMLLLCAFVPASAEEQKTTDTSVEEKKADTSVEEKTADTSVEEKTTDMVEGQKAPDYIMEGYDGDSSGHVWDTNLFFARRQEQSGISFQFRQYTEYERWEERKDTILNGEDLPDVFFKASFNAGEIRDLYAKGYIIDLKPYLEQYAPDLWALLQSREDWMAAVTMEDGSIPCLPNFNALQNNDLMWINTTWLKAVGLEMPTTAEELTEVLRAFKTKDPNRNGGADEVPLTFIGMWELRFLAHAFGIIDNDYYMSVEDGKVVSHLTSDENRAFLTWLNTLWEEKLIDHAGFTNVDTLRQNTETGKPVTYGMIMSSSPLTVVASDALKQFSALPPLKYNGEQVYRDLLGDVIRGTFAITKDCKEPEKLVEWVNFLFTEEGSRLAQAGLEGVEYIWNEDGYWEWNTDMSTVANVTLPESTISEGGSAPGLTSVDFQLKYADEETRRIITEIHEMGQYTKLPYPYVILTAEDEKQAAKLQAAIAPYAERTMAAFVVGDLKLTDESWKEFCDEVERLGLSEMTALWQKYIK